MTVWIGYLQWQREHGYFNSDDPILRETSNFRCMDAILEQRDDGSIGEPDWPRVDFIVGNPPFLGNRLMRRALGDAYVDTLRGHYAARLPGQSDLCCYWFEKARRQIATGRCRRAGLLATQGIRGQANRAVLSAIRLSGGIFFAVADRPWVLDGANVHVSLVAFDDGLETSRTLDGRNVDHIYANLTARVDVTQAARLVQNSHLGFYGDVKAGRFDISDSEALNLLQLPNPNGRPNSDVVVPYAHGEDVLTRSRSQWVVDFGVDASAGFSMLYERPFQLVADRVRPARELVNRKRYREYWWLHAEPCREMRTRIAPLSRFLVSPVTSKHRAFVWASPPLIPDHALFVVARSDDHLFGVLQSRIHEVWARAQGTQLRERESGFRYTPTTCFETFPLPNATPEQAGAISEAARELDRPRDAWLNPREWTRQEVLQFPGSVDGPWARYVHDADERGIGTVRWPRTVPRDAECAAKLAQRTLTNLYNARPDWLAQAHARLDSAVCAAYGWDADVSDEEILERLLELNLAAAAG